VEEAVAADRRQRLIDTIETLDVRDRDVVVCRYLLDLSEAETAAALDLPKGTVKSRTARALVKLRALLDPASTGPASTGPASTGEVRGAGSAG
jgi:RNA polymerase sigma factor (sigma-70 family)